jgi:hypothetical protein
MCGEAIPLFVLHDFDKSGFSILGTLRQDTRRYEFLNEVEVVDLGLRLEDIKRLKLQPESAFDKGDEANRFANLRQNGATAAEAEFLLRERVELNAMTSRQLVTFVEKKLVRHGVKKIVPTRDTLAETYRLFARSRKAERILERELKKLNGGLKVTVPRDLQVRVRGYLRQHPTMRWDEAVAAIVASA